MRWLGLLVALPLSACGGKGERNGEGGAAGDSGSAGAAALLPPGCVRGVNPTLDLAIRGALSLPPGTVPTAEQLAGVRGLSPLRLASLDGIQCLPGLVTLQLTEASVTDLSPLAGLSSLDELAFYSSFAPNVESLGGAAEGLLTLRLLNTPFADLSGLSSLQALERLEVRDGGLENLETLPLLRGLKHLVLDGNPLTDVSDVLRLPALEELSVNKNLLESLSGSNGHPTLRSVKAAENALTTLGDLNLPELISLSVGANRIEGLGSLNGVASLVDLALGGNPLDDLAGIAAASRIHQLSLAATAVELTELAALKDLQELNLYDARVSDLSPLAALPDVRRLILDSSDVTDLAPLQAWTTLDGRCRTIQAEDVELVPASLDLARQLCSAGWQVTPICDGSCVP